MKVFINPRFEYLRPDILRLVKGDYVPDKVFCNKRNVVEKVTLQDEILVVKRFKRPTIANCFVYTFLRKSKARRAYEHAMMLLEKDIATPFPVAYIEVKRHGLFHTGYYISEYTNLPTLAEFKSRDEGELQLLATDLIRYTLDLKRRGVMPLDYNPGNIFYKKSVVSGHYEFELTDINRMRFGRFIGGRDVVNAFEQFGVPTEKLYYFMRVYSVENGVDIEWCMYQFLAFRLRKKIKRFLKGKAKEGVCRCKHSAS